MFKSRKFVKIHENNKILKKFKINNKKTHKIN